MYEVTLEETWDLFAPYLDGACRLFGRDAVAFKSFEHMLDDAQSKQAAWALLKKLPRFGER